MLPTTSDPCGQISYSRPTKPREHQPIAKVDWQVNQSHGVFARYQLSTSFWDPAFLNAIGNILAATLGGRDNQSHSLAMGDTWVMSNTMVNNLRLSINRTSVVRTHAPCSARRRRREDVQPRPDYMNITTTGAFSIQTRAPRRSRSTSRTPTRSPTTSRWCAARTSSGSADGRYVELEDGIERAVDGTDLVQRRRHRAAARRLPARQGVRVP
jgi:hypothetical protein